jgi:hypothetical protein
MRRPLLAALAVVTLIAGVLVVRSLTASPERSSSAAAPARPIDPNAPVRPKLPPGPDDPRPQIREPKSPAVDEAWKAAMTEKLRGSANPGEAAFTAYADRFVDENLELAEQQARAEGLTLPEVRALTRLGLLVMATQRLPDVEEVLGHELPPETKEALADMVQRENGAFKDQMRALVAKKAPEEERWKLISAADARFRSEFFKISGMTAAQLDDMLAGNLLLPGAPGGTPAEDVGPGDSTEPGGVKDDLTPRPRPTSPN